MPYLLPFFLIFLAWLTYQLRKHERIRNQAKEDYWTREQTANLTRRKNIDDLNYITIPLDSLPFFEINDQLITKYQKVIKDLSQSKILNLTGTSNTDLKLEYGSSNLTQLSTFDGNFTTLVNTISKWGDRLILLGYEKEAITVLEFGITCSTDVSANYYMLAKYYSNNHMASEINRLIEKASSINSLMKDTIIKNLNNYIN